MKIYITDRNVRYKGKTYSKGACIEASTEEEKEILKDLVRQGYASENIVNIGGATEIINREREDLNEKKEELKKLESSLKLKENKLNEKEEKLNQLEITLIRREEEVTIKEKEYEKYKTINYTPIIGINSEEKKTEINEEIKEELNTPFKNSEIYGKFLKKEKIIYEELSEEEKDTVGMLGSYEDVKVYLNSMKGS